jgi:hypothetical protein
MALALALALRQSGQYSLILAIVSRLTRRCFRSANPTLTETPSLSLSILNPDRRKNDPRKVLDHDFPISELGKICQYEVYVLNSNIGFVNVGTSHDTAEFAVESISR